MSKLLSVKISKYAKATRLKTRRLNKNAPKAKTHRPKKGKGSFYRRFIKALADVIRL